MKKRLEPGDDAKDLRRRGISFPVDYPEVSRAVDRGQPVATPDAGIYVRRGVPQAGGGASAAGSGRACTTRRRNTARVRAM